MPSLSPEELTTLGRLCAAFGDIDRAIFMKGWRFENDAEHSWNLSIFAWSLLARDNPRNLSLEKVLRYALIHDLVEVYAGDTVFNDKAGLATKHEREIEALARLRLELSESQPDLIAAIQAYEDRVDEEAVFVYALDKIIPIYIGIATGARYWHAGGITPAIIAEHKKAKVGLDPQIAQYFEAVMAELERRPDLFTPWSCPALVAGERYRDLEGGEYEIITVAQHAEIDQTVVVYKTLKDGLIWTRPAWAFGEEIMVEGVSRRLFARLD